MTVILESWYFNCSSAETAQRGICALRRAYTSQDYVSSTILLTATLTSSSLAGYRLPSPVRFLPLFTIFGAPEAVASRSAVGFVLLSAVSWLWLFGRQEYKNGYST